MKGDGGVVEIPFAPVQDGDSDLESAGGEFGAVGHASEKKNLAGGRVGDIDDDA